jgi:hypothetical protein
MAVHCSTQKTQIETGDMRLLRSEESYRRRDISQNITNHIRIKIFNFLERIAE